MRIAILDDYQDVALSCADWNSLPGPPDITVFNEHIARHETLATALRPFDVIVAMRERTPFGAGLLSLLPGLRLLVTTGMANAAIDLAAAQKRCSGPRHHPLTNGRKRHIMKTHIAGEVRVGLFHSFPTCLVYFRPDAVLGLGMVNDAAAAAGNAGGSEGALRRGRWGGRGRWGRRGRRGGRGRRGS